MSTHGTSRNVLEPASHVIDARQVLSPRASRALHKGYLVVPSLRDSACRSYQTLCEKERRPLVIVTVRRGRAAGFIDFDTTARWSADAAVGLEGDGLPAVGAVLIRAFFETHAAPRAWLFCATEGSVAVTIDGIPATEADALGALLSAAATAATKPDGGSAPTAPARARPAP